MVRIIQGPPLRMDRGERRPVVAFVSPFLDKKHGTERRVVEWINQLADAFEIHIYSQRVEDIDLTRAYWHRVPSIPGPHLLKFVWWVTANQAARFFDKRFHRKNYDLIFSPGVNCFDADVVSVHIVFGEYVHRVKSKLGFRRNAIRTWPRLFHRRLYYRLLGSLERRVFTDPKTTIILIAKKTGIEITRHYGRSGPFPVVYLGIDHESFNPGRRNELRAAARSSLGIPENEFVLLLIGNDWRNKGVPALLEALLRLRDLPVRLYIVSSEDSAECKEMIERYHLADRVRLVVPRPDVEFYYAAADAYVGPSLEDTFALPPAEAMACGLAVIVSSANGTSEIITEGSDGLVLADPQDGAALVAMIRRLIEEPSLKEFLARNAAETARQFTWERNGRELADIFEQVLAQKKGKEAHTFAQESQTR
jgi:glycosyltransferase involved in cell wall biosynthesis